MVRNLMMIFGLTLAVAAFGCDSDSTGDGGSTGNGGSGGSGGAAGAGGAGEGGAGGSGAADACLNDSDLAAVCDAGWTAAVTACATTAGGQGAATSTCLQLDPPGASEACADCFGGLTQCIFDNCVIAGGSVCAIDPQGAACEQCQDDSGCTAAGEACTGEYVCE
jgi:hypothetical protein